jgi:hypothetical protein
MTPLKHMRVSRKPTYKTGVAICVLLQSLLAYFPSRR